MFVRIAFVLVAALALDGPPATPKRPVVDAYHGAQVTDDYRWLEDWEKPEVKAWSEAQNRHARSVLDPLPGVAAIRARLTEILGARTDSWFDPKLAGGRLFVSKMQPPKQQPYVVVLDSPDKPEDARVVFDPTALDPSGATSYDWFVPSPDGKLLAVSVSRGGSECGDAHVYDVATGKEAFEAVARVNGGTAGGDLEWAPDSRGFYYTRYPRAGERPAEDLDFYTQVWFHELGTPVEKDRYEIGKDFPRIAEIQLDASASGGRLLASVQNGDGGEFVHLVRAADGKWTQITRFEDRIVQAAFGAANDLFLISRKDAPRGKVLRLSLARPTLDAATTVIAEGPDTIASDFLDPDALRATATRLYVRYQLGGPSEFRVFDLEGRRQTGPRFLPVSMAALAVVLPGDDLLFFMTSFLEPDAYWRFEAKSGATTKSALASRPVVDLADCEVVRETATSRDGTKVPVTVLKQKGIALDGTSPCVLTGYGGYGIDLEPTFSPARRALLEQGVILAVANLRGGGEFGEEWHRQGSLTRKQNVFDDFAAAAQLLIDRKYAARERLAIEGASNGGLLMGAALTQHPELFRCVVSHVGIYDMLRVELSPNGAFNTTEFGTVKDPAQFQALFAYSPYHHVKDGVKYPDVLFLTGANDPRVDPMQSRKMTARLQAAVASSPPQAPTATILLRTSANSGHGFGTALSEEIEQQVDVDAFLLHELGVKIRPVGAKG